MNIIAKCTSADSGSKNKQAFVECLSKPEIYLDGEKVSILRFLLSKRGGHFDRHVAVNIILKCVCMGGGCKNKAAFLECLTNPEIDLDGKKVSLHSYLVSEKGCGLRASEAIHLIARCISEHGGSKNKQALIDCFFKIENELDGKSLFNFLRSLSGGDLSAFEVTEVLSKCLSQNNGNKNKEAFLESLTKLEIDLNGERVSLYKFLTSEHGCGLIFSEAIQVLMRCVGCDGGYKNKQALVECLVKPEVGLGGMCVYAFFMSEGICSDESIQILVKCIGWFNGALIKSVLIDCFCVQEMDCDGDRVSLYHFLTSDKGMGLSKVDAIRLMARCIGVGGARSKQAFIECISKSEMNLNGERVSLYKYLMSEQLGRLSKASSLDLIVRCIGLASGSRNKQELIDCLSKKKIDLDGKKVTLFEFFCSKDGGDLRASEAIHLVVKCIGFGRYLKNKQVIMDCFCEKEMYLDGRNVSLFTFISSAQGCGLMNSETVKLILRCMSNFGGYKCKQALIECLTKRELCSDEKQVTLFRFLSSKQGGGLSDFEAIQVIGMCVGQGGGFKNKQALIDCLNIQKIDLDGKKVTLLEFFCSEQGGGMDRSEAMLMIAKSMGCGGGSKNKQALIECFCKEEIVLEDGQEVSLFTFLSLEKGGNLTTSEAIKVIMKCISSEGGCKNKKALIECLTKPELDLNGEKVTLYKLLRSKQGCDLSAFKVFQCICMCFGHGGGSKNKQALIDFFYVKEIDLSGKKVSLYTFLRSNKCGSLNTSDAIQVIMKCIGHGGGSKNKQAFLDGFCDLNIDLNGKKVSLFQFFCSKNGGDLTPSKAIQFLSKCIGVSGGSKNMQALMGCLVKDEIDLDGKTVSLYHLLISKEGCCLSRYEALRVLMRCVGNTGGAQNIQALKECFNLKFLGVGQGNRSLYETFLSGGMTPKEALSLCIVFSVNRYAWNAKDILVLFELKKIEDDRESSAIGLINSLGFSCYSTLLHLATKAVSDSSRRPESKQAVFKASCQSLVDMFVNADSFFNKKLQDNPSWLAPDLGGMCMDACSLYVGKDICRELNERESVVVDWIRQFAGDYQLTKDVFNVITHVQSLDDLRLVIALCNAEIEQKRETKVDRFDCENVLTASFQILKSCNQSTMRAILKYKEIFLNWCDLKKLSMLLRSLRTLKTDESIYFFFENREKIDGFLAHKNTQRSFLIYMRLSALTPDSLLPLKLEGIQRFFKTLERNDSMNVLAEKSEDFYSQYAIYINLNEQEKSLFFHEIVKGIPKIFGSYAHFQNVYQYKIQKKDWALLYNLTKKWDLRKENLTQSEFSFLIRIRYKFQKDIAISCSDLSILKNDEKGCRVVNQTVYPNWVFALVYLQKVLDYRGIDCCFLVRKKSVVFQFDDVTEVIFPLFKIQLDEQGVMFEGESVNSVRRFYEAFKLDKFFCYPQESSSEKAEILSRKRKRSGDMEGYQLPLKYQKGLDEQTGIAGLVPNSRKREGESIESKSPSPKEIKLITTQDIYELYETVSRQEVLTENECEIFMQGACYLSQEMLASLMRKQVLGIGNKEIQEKWQRFVQRHQNKEREKMVGILDDFFEMSGQEIELLSNENPVDTDCLLLQPNKSLLTPMPDFNEELSILPPITFDSLFNFWKQDFESEFSPERSDHSYQ